MLSEVPGVLICGHGSRDAEAGRELAALVRNIAEQLPQFTVEYGCLELARPTLDEGLDALRRRGIQRIAAVPGMLFAAGHVQHDIPAVLKRYRESHPEIAIWFGRELGLDPRMTQAALDRIRQMLSDASTSVPIQETLLVVVGRGSSDVEANANTAVVAEALREELDVGRAETCYAGVGDPLAEPALERAAGLGYRRVIVFPYFLFTGVLVKRIYALADTCAAQHADVEFIKAPWLGNHPLVVETFVERVRELLGGEAAP